MRLLVPLAALALFSVPASAEPKMDVHGLILGDEGARYLKGALTIDLQQHRGAAQVRFLGFDHSSPMFAVGFFNASSEPANIDLEDLHVSVNGAPVTVFSAEDLKRKAKNRAMWKSIGLALVGAIGSASAASQRNSYSGSVIGPYGSYSFYGSYPSLAGQLRANQISSDTAFGMAAIQQRLDVTISGIGNNVIQRTTIDPGMAYGGLLVADKLDYGRAPLDVRLELDWNGERYDFGYLFLKPRQAVPEQYASILADNAKPRMLPHFNAGQPDGGSSAASTAKTDGWIYLRSGAVKIPAKTASGYCLKAPPGYVATGAIDTPVITKALPRCTVTEQ